MISLILSQLLFVGHHQPLNTELLQEPIHLKCGVVIMENHNSKLDIEDLDELCLWSKVNFFSFIKEKNISPTHHQSFKYQASFLPDTHNYRGLNDVVYRFFDRPMLSDVTGYTVHDSQYMFIIDDPSDSEFEVSFAHEMFHALSDYYGVFNNHPGNKFDEDEILAQEFTQYIGLGK